MSPLFVYILNNVYDHFTIDVLGRAHKCFFFTAAPILQQPCHLTNTYTSLLNILTISLPPPPQVNKMSTQNIAIVMAPNLLWTRLEEGFNMTATGTHSLVVDALIQHCDWFFPEGR